MIPFLQNVILYNSLSISNAYKFWLNSRIKRRMSFINNNIFIPYQIANYLNSVYLVADRLTKEYKKLPFNIKAIIDEKEIVVTEKIIAKKPFCNLVHFKKNSKKKQPKLFIVSPMAGHYSTLLKGTVEGLVADYDIYLTDWIDAKQVPLKSGSFDMDDYIDYVIEFLDIIGPDANIMAVCQPTVPVLAAVALMSEDKNKNVPKSMILMGGPIDTRKSPTLVDQFAVDKDIEWFENNVITQVPKSYPGAGRKVYPGFIQLSGFIMMNLDRHIGSHISLAEMSLRNDKKAVDKQKAFYDEYFAVMDLPAEFYLQTVQKVFKDQDLAKGKLYSRNRKIDLSKIRDSAILAVEGENDDIAGIGQTKAAINLCTNIPASKKKYHMQEDVGHYGIFSGSKYRKYIVPIIKEFTKNI